MKTNTVTLRDGSCVFELRPSDDGESCDHACVVGGTVERRGDVLRKPSHLTWEEAAEEVAPGRTELSPFDLELARDAMTHSSYLPEGGLEELCRLSEELAAGPDSTIRDAEFHEAVDHLMSDLDGLAEDANGRHPRRRKSDAA
jgi:hypothetical protein